MLKYQICLILVVFLSTSCTKETVLKSGYPIAVDIQKVGEYPELTMSGAGYVYDDVLEYRVWVHPGGDDFFRAFATFEEADRYSKSTENAEIPLVLVLQHEHINETEPGVYEHIKEDRITEWKVEWLEGSKRGPGTIEDLLEKLLDSKAQPVAGGDATR